MKKAVRAFLVLLLLACPVAAPTQFQFATNADNTLSLVAYTGPGGSVVIPTNFNGLIVSDIGSNAFLAESNVTSVTFPDTVTNIGERAFEDCTGLTNLVIPASVISLQFYAFAGCANLVGLYFTGNAPAADAISLYDSNTNEAAYYLPGMTGWTVFADDRGIPVLLWNPLIQTGDGFFGVRSNQFGFNITGTTNIPIVVQACTNLANPVWTPLANAALTNGQFYFSDPQWANCTGRYYRITAP